MFILITQGDIVRLYDISCSKICIISRNIRELNKLSGYVSLNSIQMPVLNKFGIVFLENLILLEILHILLNIVEC